MVKKSLRLITKESKKIFDASSYASKTFHISVRSDKNKIQRIKKAAPGKERG